MFSVECDPASVGGSKHRLQEIPGYPAVKNNRGKVVERDLIKICFSRFLPPTLFKYPQISPFLPKYAQIPPSLMEGIQWCSWARSPLEWAKGGAG